ncbi:MAG: signal peptidase II [Spirochaetia bacterium]
MSIRTVKAIVALLLVCAAAGWDQGTKLAARAWLAGQPAVLLVDRVLVLRYAENEGAFLSLGAGFSRPVRTVSFIAFPLVVLGCMILYLMRRGGMGWGTLVGFSLIVGGGAGNLIDRLFRDGRVSDFVMIGIGGIHTGVFNFADLSVLAGCIVLLFSPGTEKLRSGAQG